MLCITIPLDFSASFPLLRIDRNNPLLKLLGWKIISICMLQQQHSSLIKVTRSHLSLYIRGSLNEEAGNRTRRHRFCQRWDPVMCSHGEIPVYEPLSNLEPMNSPFSWCLPGLRPHCRVKKSGQTATPNSKDIHVIVNKARHEIR